MFQKKTLIVGFIVVALGLAFGTFFFRSNQKKETKRVSASTGIAMVTNQAEWELGSRTNIITTNPEGSIKMNDVAGSSEMDLSGVNFAYDFTLTNIDDTEEFVVDLGSIKNVAKIYHKYFVKTVDGQNHCSYPLSSISASADGITYGAGDLIDGSPAEDMPGYTVFGGGGGSGMIRYIKFYSSHGPGDEWCDTGEQYPYYNYQSVDLKVFLNSQATHITAATQIDGGVNFWQWETFTDSKTTPANTAVTYRYRTSTNGTDWTAWVGAIGSVTSRTGDDSNDPTKYRYLQIEATLSNTDGASTPTIDSYSIGYHTNQKPNAPTAMTAVIN